MSRRRNQGRPRGWHDQRHTAKDPTGASVTQGSDVLSTIGAPVLDDSDRLLETIAWITYKTFVKGNTEDKGEPLLRIILAHEELLRKIPNSVVTHWNLGDLYWCAARLKEAMMEYETTLQLAPRMNAAHLRVAECLLGLGEVERAKARLEIACRAPSVVPRMDLYRTEAHLLLGHYHEGWRRLEIRARHYQEGRLAVIARHVRGPLWDGRPLEGPLLIGGCDGYGDVIQCARYLPRARQRVGNLTLLVADGLVPLFRDQFDGVTVMGYSAPPDPPQFEAYHSIMCLPAVLGIQSAADIPGTPYLRAMKPFPQLGDQFKVGIRWAGQPANSHDLMRSTHLSQWAPLLAVRGVTFYSFQLEAAAAQLSEPVGAGIVNVAQALGNWGTTAAALSQMDLVIAVDCSLAHLAGALNLPVWIPLPAAVEWRWGLESPTTPWYPSARLFRQRRIGEWPAIFQEIAVALEHLARERTRCSA